MKKIYFCFLVLFVFVGFTSADDHKRVWTFDDWTEIPTGQHVEGNWRGGGSGSTVALSEDFPIGTSLFNFSAKALELNVPSDNGGLVFEGITPAFDRSKYNAISFLIYAPGTADWRLELMNAASQNQWNTIVKTDSTTVNDWFELVFEIPFTIANDITKYVIKPRSASAWGLFYIDDITFFKIVRPDPTEIEITNQSSTVLVGKRFNLGLDFTPEDADKDLDFESSNPGVATVSSTGVVTAIAAGSAVIKATSKVASGVSATFDLNVVEADPLKTYTAYDFETTTWVPTHGNYTNEIVDNPAPGGINTSLKVLSMTSLGGAWQWMNWNDSHAVNDVEFMKFKIFSETEIAEFNLEFGVGAGNYTIPTLAANTWTEISVPLPNYRDSEQGIYTFTKNQWNAGTIYLDDIMFVAGDGAGYVPVTAIGALTGGSITKIDGTLTLATPEFTPANATNKELIWSIVSSVPEEEASEPEDNDSEPKVVATIDSKTGEITALLNGTITVMARTRDLGFTTNAATVVIDMIDDTSIKDPAVDAVRLYPNPAQDVVYLSYHNNIEQVRVFNIAGQLMLNAAVNNNQFDISSLIKGIYLVEIIAADNVRSITKLVVK